jgi:hypothetical protein
VRYLADIYNATCIILEPTSNIADLQATHSERAMQPVRCRCTEMSAQRAAGAIGILTTLGWTVRLQTKARVAAGWRLRVTLDKDGQERLMVVIQPSGMLHTVLKCEGVKV